MTNTEYEFIGWEALLEVWAPRVLGAVLVLQPEAAAHDQRPVAVGRDRGARCGVGSGSAVLGRLGLGRR